MYQALKIKHVKQYNRPKSLHTIHEDKKENKSSKHKPKINSSVSSPNLGEYKQSLKVASPNLGEFHEKNKKKKDGKNKHRYSLKINFRF